MAVQAASFNNKSTFSSFHSYLTLLAVILSLAVEVKLNVKVNMVKVKQLPRAVQITLLPNRSLTWQQTRLIMVVFGSFCLSIALIWSFVGAWLILPFAGIEVGLLAFVMYLVSKNTYDKQSLIINEQYVCLSFGRQSKANQMLFKRDATKLITYEVNHPEDVKELYLTQEHNKKRLGEFLNLEDQKVLLLHLAKYGLKPQEIKKSVEIEL